ncbi:hypothetical protein [Acidithiobacillus marinus]|uniref:hypothetical protein n=1 Tax=Acidithiobacillus marinus TaxID=187490 RepID=UPI001552921B|nr:hypothetical protein [Acidithiobacillus marinus]
MIQNIEDLIRGGVAQKKLAEFLTKSPKVIIVSGEGETGTSETCSIKRTRAEPE